MKIDLKVACATLGCKVNQYDSQSMLENLHQHGYQIVDEGQDADIYIINTCAVTNESERKSRQTVRKLKHNHPDSIIVMMGCFPQTNIESASSLGEADIIIGTHNRMSLPKMIQEYLIRRERMVDLTSDHKDDPIVTEFHDKTRASIKIQDGCGMFCSYCIIPYARNEITSVNSDIIIDHINHLITNGYQEITLTGIHLASYTDAKKNRLIDLIERINHETTLTRLRLGSLEPRLLTKAFIQRLRACKNVCEQFHLSLQSGNDDVLRAMNRRYDTEEFKQIVYQLRASFPNAHLTTDIIVGFPGETEAMFEDTIKIVRDIKFSDVHVFPYSPKQGTPASERKDQLANKIKHRRAKLLIEVANEIRHDILQAQIGSQHEVLFEKEINDREYEGYTRTYLPVRCKYHLNLCNKKMIVEIIGTDGRDLFAAI